jgi:type III pantothenate kinase
LLVVDAGTVLSLNRIDRSGRFIGGRLLAGLTLQWQAMAAGTAGLPDTVSGLKVMLGRTAACMRAA